MTEEKSTTQEDGFQCFAIPSLAQRFKVVPGFNAGPCGLAPDPAGEVVSWEQHEMVVKALLRDFAAEREQLEADLGNAKMRLDRVLGNIPGSPFEGAGTGITRFGAVSMARGDGSVESISLMPGKKGEWCKYEDHKEAVDNLYALMERRDRDVMQARKGARAANDQYRGLRDNRRFEAAKAAMQGLLAGRHDEALGELRALGSTIAPAAVAMADALLEALSGDGGITHEED